VSEETGNEERGGRLYTRSDEVSKEAIDHRVSRTRTERTRLVAERDRVIAKITQLKDRIDELEVERGAARSQADIDANP